MQQVRCEGCSQLTPSYEIIHYGSMDSGGYRQLCTRCYNVEVAARCELDDFEHVDLEPVMMLDREGKAHVFYFRTRLFGAGVAIDAFELRDDGPGGYKFKVIGDPKVELLTLLGQLIEKMRRALSVKHIEDTDLGVQIAGEKNVVRGRIEWDEARDDIRVPMLVIDGREIDWDEFGRTLMSFEGFQFKLEIHDLSDEV